MFFTINKEKKIGFKELSVADLGLGPTSNQTHIGLYQNMLDFLDDEDTTSGMLIYEDYCDILKCDFDRIQNPDGTYRSPKIRMGTTGDNTIVKQIRAFAAANPKRRYYLLWFGLDSNELLFWLMDNTSNDFFQINRFLPIVNKVYNVSQINFRVLLDFIESKINQVSVDILKDLEIASQIGVDPTKSFKPTDIEKAQKRFKDTGRKGEELINDYLERLKIARSIHSFQWDNKSRESGKPFDFTINPGRPDENYVDVKSTLYQFSQPLFFSNGEVHFIQSVNADKYSVYRVYDMDSLLSKLRICQQCQLYMRGLDATITSFQNTMAKTDAKVNEMKIAVRPNNTIFGNILAPINL
jgi:hypothetical protein